MPYALTVRHDLRLVTRTVWGVYDDDQAIASVHDLAAIEGSDVYDEIHDLSGVTSYEVSAKVVQSMALDSVSREGREDEPKRVGVVTSEAFTYGMARLYGGYHADSKESMRYFTDLDEALAWILGQPDR